MDTNPYPENYIKRVTLKDGSPVTLRPIRPDDAPRLQEGFSRLSAETIYLRFMESYKELSDEQAYEYANLDYLQRMAFVGAIQEEGEERLVVVARYARLDKGEPGGAEAAIVVRDDYQGLGLGTFAMQHLVNYARDHGIRYFQATVHMSNSRILNFIAKSGLPYEREMLEPGAWSIRVWLNRDS